MPRPVNKTQLLNTIQKTCAALEKTLASASPEQMSTPPAPGAWAVKDIIAHLYEWQQMVFSWYETGLRGETPAVPAPGYKWNQLPALNQHIYAQYHSISPAEALELWRASHQRTLQWIEALSEQDLAAPGLYPWMNQNNLMAYLNSVTAAHYLWAHKEIRQILRD